MAGQHGGARVPTNPAPVSGPGALSKRTDGQPIRDLPNAGYGENAEFTALQQGAPLAGGSSSSPRPSVTPFGAPSAYPEQPVTNGAAAGAGAGASALGFPTSPYAEQRSGVQNLPPGQVAAMIRRAQEPDASPEFKRLVRQVLAYS